MKLPRSLALALFVTSSANAAEFCVATADDLIAALYAAEGNAESNTIKLVQGTYNGNFFYNNASPYALVLDGGYAAGCASRQNNPDKTLLSGHNVGAGTVLTLNSTTGSAQFTVSNLAVRYGGSGGLDLRTDKTSRRSKVTLKAVRLYNNGGVGAKLVARTVIVRQSSFDTSFSSGLVIDAAATATVQSSRVLRGGSYGVDITADTIKLNGTRIRRSGPLGGAHLTGKQVTVSRSRFIRNFCYYCDTGGGAYIAASASLLLDGNTFLNNVCNGLGGAIHFTGGRATIKNNQIRGNFAYSGGGGLALYASSSVLLANNMIAGNNSVLWGGGGGVDLRAVSASLTGNLIYGNYAPDGGGVRAQAASITLTNNTVTGNHAGGSGGGASLLLSANTDTANVSNNLIWNNTASTGGDLYIANGDLVRSVVNMQNNNFNQAKPGGYYIKQSFPIPASNLNNVDPLFADAANGDYHLQSGSPVIDLGDDAAPELPTTDMDGDARILGAHVDIGADEHKP